MKKIFLLQILSPVAVLAGEPDSQFTSGSPKEPIVESADATLFPIPNYPGDLLTRGAVRRLDDGVAGGLRARIIF